MATKRTLLSLLGVALLAPSAHAQPGVLRVELPRGAAALSATLRCRDGAYVLTEDSSQRVLWSHPRAGVTRLDVFGAPDRDDTLTLDWTQSLCVPAGGLRFDGGAAGFDTLRVDGGSFETVTFDYTDAHSGDITYEPANAAPVRLHYEGLEPLTNTGSAVNLVFNLPSGGPGANLARLVDDGVPGNNISRLEGLSFEATNFTNPTGSLTVRAGGGFDSIGLCCGFESGRGAGQFSASLNLTGFNMITVNSPLDLAGSVSLSGANISLPAGLVTTTGSQTYAATSSLSLGGVTPVVLTSTGMGDLVLSGPLVDAGRDLVLNTAGVTRLNSTMQLSSIVTDAPGSTVLSVGTLTTAGTQSFRDAVTLGANATLAALNSSAITFASTVNGAFALALNTQGASTFGGTVGGVTPLASVSTDAGGTVAFNGGTVRTSGAQSYGDACTLTADVALTSSAGALTFDSTLAVGARTLTLSSPSAANLGARTTLAGGTISASSGVSLDHTDALVGAGAVNGAVNAAMGTLVSPGDTATGVLRTGALAWAGTTYRVDLLGTTAGTGYDQVQVTGTVDLTGSTLALNAGFAAPSGSSFTIVDNDGADPVVGTFEGMPEGTYLMAGTQRVVLTYQGGTGNDVVLAVCGCTDAVTCGGHGTCNGACGCTCEAGHAGMGCAACAPGTSAAAGQASCQPCAAGSFSMGGAASCTACGTCDDGDPCTADRCEATSGCVSVRMPGCVPPADAGPEVADVGVEVADASDASSLDAVAPPDVVLAADAARDALAPDAATGNDAAAALDAGTTTRTPGGCGCSAPGPRRSGLGAVLVGLGALLARGLRGARSRSPRGRGRRR